MKKVERLYSFAAACVKASTELLYYSFIWIVIAFYSLEATTLIAWLLLLIIGYSSFQLLFRNKVIHNLKVAITIVLFSGATYLLLQFGLQAKLGWISSILLVVFTFFFFISGYRQYKFQFQHSFHITLMALSILGHVTVQIVKVVWLTELQTISMVLNIFGISAVLLTLFISNERMLVAQQQLLGKSTVLKQAIHLNRIILSFISIVIIAIILFRSWQETIEQYIKAFFNWLINLFNSQEKQVEEKPPVEALPQIDFGGESIKEPSILSKIFETIFMVLAYIALAIVIIGVMFLIVRLLINAFTNLLNFLKKRNGIQEDMQTSYIDEIETIEKASKKMNKRVKKTIRSNRNWNGMTKHEKCTHLYTLFILQLEKNGYQYLKQLTVKEQMEAILKQQQQALTTSQTAKLTTIYEQARYGFLNEEEIDVTNEELQLYYKLFTST